MDKLWPHRPSAALIISGIALFVSLGGSGYAATRLDTSADTASRGKSNSIAKPLTISHVNKLIAAYLAAHHGLRGPEGPPGSSGATGSPGATGQPGQTGPQGPGAQRIEKSLFGEAGPNPVVTIGPWTVWLTCNAPSEALVGVSGPGSIIWTVSLGPIAGTAITNSNTSPLGSGISVAAAHANEQMDLHGFLTAGSTMEQFDLEVTDVKGLSNSCSIVGDAIPVS